MRNSNKQERGCGEAFSKSRAVYWDSPEAAILFCCVCKE
jgi:hypothetical protein